jgi:hypothetical protein
VSTETEEGVKHSPLPWRICPNEMFITSSDLEDWDDWIVRADGSSTSIATDEANAALIVKSVNAYPRLVEMLKRSYFVVDNDRVKADMRTLFNELGEIK